MLLSIALLVSWLLVFVACAVRHRAPRWVGTTLLVPFGVLAVIHEIARPSWASVLLGILLAFGYAPMVRSALKVRVERANDGDAEARPKPKAPPFEVAIDMQRVSELGDLAALGRLWEHLYLRPLDHSRPVDEVIAEVELAINATYGPDASR